MLEKALFTRLGIPVPRTLPSIIARQLLRALGRLGLPGVLKTRRFGYDGKGQALIRSGADAEAAWALRSASP